MMISCRPLALAFSIFLWADQARSDIEGTSSIPTLPGSSSSTTVSMSTSSTAPQSEESPKMGKTDPGTLTQPGPPVVSLTGEWVLPSSVILLDTDTTVRYRLNGAWTQQLEGGFGAILAWTSAGDAEQVTSTNSWAIIQLVGPCRTPGNAECVKDTQRPFDALSPAEAQNLELWKEVIWNFSKNPNFESTIGPDNFFLCFGSKPVAGGPFECREYSEFFTIPNSAAKDINSGNGFDEDASIATPSLPISSGALTIGATNPYITYQDMPTALLPTVTAAETTTSMGTTITPTETSPASTNIGTQGAGSTNIANPTSGKPGLSTGAIVGVALGILVFVSLLAALALFFCIRRRRRAASAGSTHEQAMLTRSHPESLSQDGLPEKDNAVHTLIHPNSNDSTFLYPDQNDNAARQTLIPVGAAAYGASSGDNSNSNNNGGFRDTENDREIHFDNHALTTPSSTAAVYHPTTTTGKTSSPPRRKPTNASTASAGAVSALSRNVSSATTSSAVSYDGYPVHSPLQEINEEGGNTIDSQPRYGETPRHLPSVVNSYDGGSGRGTPFLSEPGMTAEEIARLDEEERRIDAAIAAADEARERERERGRKGSGGGGGMI